MFVYIYAVLHCWRQDVLHHFSQNATICRQHKNNLNSIFFLKLYRTHFVFLCHKDATDLKKNKKQLEENPKNTNKKNENIKTNKKI